MPRANRSLYRGITGQSPAFSWSKLNKRNKRKKRYSFSKRILSKIGGRRSFNTQSMLRKCTCQLCNLNKQSTLRSKLRSRSQHGAHLNHHRNQCIVNHHCLFWSHIRRSSQAYRKLRLSPHVRSTNTCTRNCLCSRTLMKSLSAIGKSL